MQEVYVGIAADITAPPAVPWLLYACRRDIVEGGKMYQSGIYVDVTSKEKLLNYLTTV